jgi:hypothetical protein
LSLAASLQVLSACRNGIERYVPCCLSYLSGYPVILHFCQFHILQAMREDKQEKHLFDLAL